MTKLLFASLLTVLALDGCAKLPLASTAEPERETVVHHAPLSHASRGPSASASAPVAEGYAGVPGLYVDHHLPTATATGAQHASTASETSAPGFDNAAAVRPATLDIAAMPTQNFRAFPVFASQIEVTDVRLSPPDVPPSWTLTPTYGTPIVFKVAVTLTDDDSKQSTHFDVSADDLGWPKTFMNDSDVSLPLDRDEVLQFFKDHPKLQHLGVQATPEDASGAPIKTKSGKPLSLELSVQVL